MKSAPEPVGTIEVALGHAGKLLMTEPALAAEQAQEVLKAAPGHPSRRCSSASRSASSAMPQALSTPCNASRLPSPAGRPPITSSV